MAISAAAIATPQQLYQGSPGIANPTTALSLSTDSATTSSLDSGTTYYVQNDWTGWTGRTTVGSSQSSITISTTGNDILTSVVLPTNSTGVGIYVGTASNPPLLGTISSNGSITYAGGATSGLAASVSGSTISITISATAASGAPSAHTVNDATTVLFDAPANDANTPSPTATATLTSIVAVNGDGSNIHNLSLWAIPSGYAGGTAGDSTPGPAYAVLFQTPIQAGDMINDAPVGMQLSANSTLIGAQDGAEITLPNGTKALPIGLVLSGVTLS